MNKKEKIVEGIILGIGISVGIVIVSACLALLTAFVQSILTII